MNISYGMSIVGSSHIEKNVPCQDSHCFETLENGWMIAAVADGVGSAKHSEIASKMACDTFAQTCKASITKGSLLSAAKDILLKAYINADLAIKQYVNEKEDSITDYDTTLSAIIYDGERFVYGHCGDGGIVALTANGDYLKITSPQKAEDGVCVIPLRAGEQSWEFGECDEKVASILLATDGVYDNFTPYLLKGQPVEFYIPLIRWFMDNNGIGITQDNRRQVEESRKRFLCGESCKSITDDKTVVVVFNADIVPALKDDSYYAEPDWAKLQEIWNRKAYPHLYKDSNAEEDACSDSSSDSAADVIAEDTKNVTADNTEEKDSQGSNETAPDKNDSLNEAEANEASRAESTAKTKKKLFGLFGKRGKCE